MRILKIKKVDGKPMVDAGTRAKRIKEEYGTGGAGWPIEGYGLHL